jgi:hypothetical protein
MAAFFMLARHLPTGRLELRQPPSGAVIKKRFVTKREKAETHFRYRSSQSFDLHG